MEIFWEFTRKGQKLVLRAEDKQEMIGGVRETQNGFDAFAKTFTMTPERAQKGLVAMAEANDVVESFRPWELFLGPGDVKPEAEVRAVE